MELLLCVSQQANDHPYRFTGTGIQVYTFEEVLYHVYRYWKQSVDDIASPALAAWVHDTLGLSFIAAKMKDIARIEPFSERMLAFLSLIEYFDEEELTELKPDLQGWEKRLEWETYKERADDLMRRGDPGKAVALYRRALQFDENVPVLNNLSIAFMQTEAYDEACRYLKRAQEIDSNNWELALHYSEALIAAGRFEEAARAIERTAEIAPAKKPGENSHISEADILYLRGELAFKMGQPPEAISYFEKALAIAPEEQYVFRLSEVYASRRQFEKALEALAYFIPNRESNLLCLMKEAELYSMAGDLPTAIQAIKKAVELRPGYIELWLRLARYHRMNYDLENAEEAIVKALSIDAANERAILENAKIKKNMGQTKTYQQLLKGILAELKGRFREVH